MERIYRSLKVDIFLIDVITKGNFSRVVASPLLALSIFLVELFSEFEERFGLKIINWNVLSEGENGIPILIHHEPREKAKVVHLPGFEPDARL